MVDEKQGCRGKRDALKALAASDDVAWGAAYSSFGSTLYEIGKNWQLNNSGRSRPLLTGEGGGGRAGAVSTIRPSTRSQWTCRPDRFSPLGAKRKGGVVAF